ncbi:MAG: branched-chain amino acid transport system permease protein [Acidobacteriota bacterium]|jgi:branched-chain amino acid transport system permease protein|nr:branched-chain amino acid transport system permease protein [Acidobacteriota bacterium]
MELIVDYTLTHLVYLSILVIFAAGVVVLYGLAGVFTLGHQGFMAIGAYLAAGIAGLMPSGGSFGLAAALLVASVIVGVGGAAAGGLLLTGPSLRLGGDYMALATLAFSEILLAVIRNTEALGGMRGIDVVSLLPRASGSARLAILGTYALASVAMAAGSVLAVRRLGCSRLGIALRALRDDELAARSMGLDNRQARLISFSLGAGLCGLAGCLYAHFSGHVSPRDFGFVQGALVLLYVVLGGSTAVGTACAIAVVYILDEGLKLRCFGLLTGVLGDTLVNWKDAILAGLLIALLAWRPYGLLPADRMRSKR